MAMPPPLPMPPVACAAMHVPMHFPGPPSPQAPTAAIDPAEDREDKHRLWRLVDELRAEHREMRAELRDEMRAERRHMNEESAEAKAEVRRLTAQHAEELTEVRQEAANAAWHNDTWWWSTNRGPQ